MTRLPGAPADGTSRPGLLHRVLALLAVTALYTAAGKLGLTLAFVNASATAVWPPTGIAIAALLLLGNRAWPAVFVGALVVNATTAGNALTSLGIAAGNTLEGLLGASLARRLAGGPRAFERAQHVFAFAACVLVAAAVSATVGSTVLAVAELAGWNAYPAVWLTWWLGDVAGGLIVAPFLLVWARRPAETGTRTRPAEALLVLVVSIGIAQAVFEGALAALGMRHAPLSFLTIPPLVWAAFRFGPRVVVSLTILVAAVAVHGTLRGYGPFAVGSPNQGLLMLQGFMATVGVMTLAIAALVAERQRVLLAQRRLQDETEGERARLEAVLRHMPAGVFIAEAPSGRILLGNQQAERIWRHPIREATSIASYASYRGLHPDGRPYAPEEWPLARSISSGEVVENEEIEIVRGDDKRATLRVSSTPIRDAGGRIVAGVVIFHDVTAEKETERRAAELLVREQRARAEAEEGSRAKDQFLAMLGHELRNPLGAIANAAAILDLEGVSDAHAARARQIVARQIRHVTRLLDDLLDVGRVTMGRIALRREPVDLGQVVHRAVAAATSAETATSPTITADVETVWVNGDPVRLEQIVTNLLANAARFTPPDGTITLSVRATEGVAELGVTDTGQGIAPELLPRVFDLFVQGPRALDRSDGGLGIGLTLVRELTRLHGGTVGARSDGTGLGSTFTVRLPSLEAPAPTATEPSSPRPVGSRILIVEDNPDALDALRLGLELRGHEVVAARDGVEAVERALQVRPHVVLLDIGLPRLDGYEAARRIRAAAGGPIGLVAVTGYGQPDDRRRAKEAGFDAFLVKPVDPVELDRVLERLLEAGAPTASL